VMVAAVDDRRILRFHLAATDRRHGIVMLLLSPSRLRKRRAIASEKDPK
jgi:hypothetical protein